MAALRSGDHQRTVILWGFSEDLRSTWIAAWRMKSVKFETSSSIELEGGIESVVVVR